MIFSDVVQEMKNTYMQKNSAYGNNAHYTFCRFGMVSYALRLTDKASRYSTLIGNRNLPEADESIMDTLKDFITYALMAAGDLRINSDREDNDKNIAETLKLMDTLAMNEEDYKTFLDTYKNYRVYGNTLKDVVYDEFNAARYDSEARRGDYFFNLALIGLYLLHCYSTIKEDEA